jgi:arylsulfatase A-like enzyme
MRHGDWKLVRMGGKARTGNAGWELYDLSKDLAETNNLAKDHPDLLQQLIERWQKMNSEMSEPLF